MLRIQFRPEFKAEVNVKVRQHGDGRYYIKTEWDLRRLSINQLQDLFDNFKHANTGPLDLHKMKPEEAVDRVAAVLKQYLIPLTDQEKEAMAKKENAEQDAKASAKAAKTTTSGLTPEQHEKKVTDLKTKLTEAKERYQKFVEETKTELKALGRGPRGAREPSETITKTVELLKRKTGATKEEIIAETGMKAGYAAALLTRILAEKGFELTSEAIENSRAKRYRITN